MSIPVEILDSQTVIDKWDSLLDMVAGGAAEVVITEHGKPIAAMIRYEDYERLQIGQETHQTMLASDRLLRRDWDSPEEDSAWSDL